MPWRKPDLTAVPYISLAATIAGLFIARAMPSIAMIVMVGYAVLLTDPRKTFSLFFRDRVLVALWLVFFVYLFSALNSKEDNYFLLERIRLKLPFLALPVAFTVFKNKISERQFLSYLYFFLLLVLITSVTISFQFFKNLKGILHAYSEGRVIETPFNHIRYSLMISFAIVIGFYLFVKKFFVKYPLERWLILGSAIFLIYFQHLLAVRSGMAAIYLCGLYMIFHFVFRIKNFKRAMMLAGIIVVVPMIAYFTMPSVKARMNYMKYDLQQLFLFQNASGLSDAGRILSIEKGMELFKEHPVTGVGIGDLRVEMKNKLDEAPEHPRDILLPHNQFVFVAAGTGIFGLIVFVIAVFLPLMRRRYLKNWLFVCFHIIILSSFFTEATIEEQMGTGFYLSFLLLMYIFIQSNEP
ncbi:MAG TPA: O-antigen ligase family protein [Chitinophagales bacterium]|nr:O-antigen ligase family protein [Chitinophagales bacterium]